jgi:hypothetical protein
MTCCNSFIEWNALPDLFYKNKTGNLNANITEPLDFKINYIYFDELKLEQFVLSIYEISSNKRFIGPINRCGVYILFEQIEKQNAQDYEELAGPNEDGLLIANTFINYTPSFNFQDVVYGYDITRYKIFESQLNPFGLVCVVNETITLIPEYPQLIKLPHEVVPVPEELWISSDIVSEQGVYLVKTWFGGTTTKYYMFGGMPRSERLNKNKKKTIFQNLPFNSLTLITIWFWLLSAESFFYYIPNMSAYYVVNTNNEMTYNGFAITKKEPYICPIGTRLLQFNAKFTAYDLFKIQFIGCLRVFVENGREWSICVCAIDIWLNEKYRDLPEIINLLSQLDKTTEVEFKKQLLPPDKCLLKLKDNKIQTENGGTIELKESELFVLRNMQLINKHV